MKSEVFRVHAAPSRQDEEEQHGGPLVRPYLDSPKAVLERRAPQQAPKVSVSRDTALKYWEPPEVKTAAARAARFMALIDGVAKGLAQGRREKIGRG